MFIIEPAALPVDDDFAVVVLLGFAVLVEDVDADFAEVVVAILADPVTFASFPPVCEATATFSKPAVTTTGPRPISGPFSVCVAGTFKSSREERADLAMSGAMPTVCIWILSMPSKESVQIACVVPARLQWSAALMFVAGAALSVAKFAMVV